jgi:hypothetical protein
MYRWIGGLLVMAVALGAGIGCGGGSDETSSDVTKAQFVKKADSICADFKSQRLAAAEDEYNPKQRQGPDSYGAAEVEAFEAELSELAEELLTSEIVPLMKQQQEELEDLDVPAADEEKIETMLANLDKAIGELEGEGLEGLVSGSQFDAFESEAEKYGLSCPVVR